MREKLAHRHPDHATTYAHRSGVKLVGTSGQESNSLAGSNQNGRATGPRDVVSSAEARVNAISSLSHGALLVNTHISTTLRLPCL